MNWRGHDLNLLIVFDAVVRSRSVTSAAAQLNMSQSAVSHALKRLRVALQDDLFVRRSDGMTPTPRAVDLAAGVRAALDALDPVLSETSVFDPATSARRFSLAVDNRSALLLAAPLAAMSAREAPNVMLSLVPSGTLDVASMLDRGELDLALGGPGVPDGRFAEAALVECGFVALVRRDHPAGRDGILTLADMGAYPHLTLSSTGEGTGFVDEAMDRAGLRRRVACNGPLLAAPTILLRSEMIAVMGEFGARAFARHAPLEVLSLPFDTPRLRTAMLWHRRYGEAAAHRWLRGIVSRAARSSCPQAFEPAPGPPADPEDRHPEGSASGPGGRTARRRRAMRDRDRA